MAFVWEKLSEGFTPAEIDHAEQAHDLLMGDYIVAVHVDIAVERFRSVNSGAKW